MINIRFHIVSLVAVFLASGSASTMGASFIDRATVDSMHGSVDDLEAGFRERGNRLDKYRDQCGAPMSRRRSERAGQPGHRRHARRATDRGDHTHRRPRCGARGDEACGHHAGATVVGTVELQPALVPSIVDGELPSDSQAAAEEGLGDAADSNADDTAEGLLGLARAPRSPRPCGALCGSTGWRESDTNSGAQQGSTSTPTTDAALPADAARASGSLQRGWVAVHRRGGAAAGIGFPSGVRCALPRRRRHRDRSIQCQLGPTVRVGLRRRLERNDARGGSDRASLSRGSAG